MSEDWYEILELSSDAQPEEIKRQYRFLCQVWHPDKFSNASHKARAEEKMKKINAAYDVLSDFRKRRDYDAGRGPSQSGAEARQQREAEEQRRRQQEQRQREEQQRQQEAERKQREEQQRQQEAERKRQEEEAFSSEEHTAKLWQQYYRQEAERKRRKEEPWQQQEAERKRREKRHPQQETERKIAIGCLVIYVSFLIGIALWIPNPYLIFLFIIPAIFGGVSGFIKKIK
jgi:curved DNA-binding protein CbpA